MAQKSGAARRKARKANATHCDYCGQPVEAVGPVSRAGFCGSCSIVAGADKLARYAERLRAALPPGG